MVRTQEEREYTVGDFLFEAFYTGGIGGGLVALFFLAYDAIQGQVLFTPSLLGTALFTDQPAASVTGVDLKMVALFSLVHFGAFAVLGAAVAYTVRKVEVHFRHPTAMAVGLFLVFEIGSWLAASLLLPGVIPLLGVGPVAAANLLAAAGIAGFLYIEHRPDHWQPRRKEVHP